jgi:hypothetical protein
MEVISPPAYVGLPLLRLLILEVEAIFSSETSVSLQTTRRYKTEHHALEYLD